MSEGRSHQSHPRLAGRKAEGAATVATVIDTFNEKLAIRITNVVGTMWCAYAFAGLALISLPQAISGGTAPLIAWIAQTFLQLVLLSIIMVGQNIAAQASDKRALQTYKDAEALLEITDELHRLLSLNTRLTQDIHALVERRDAAAG